MFKCWHMLTYLPASDAYFEHERKSHDTPNA